MKTYIFPIEIEESSDGWSVRVPSLENRGAATWGRSRDEALRNIQEVAQMVVEEMIEDGESLPADVRVSETPAVAISV
jgi:predicted RNase H-like HicB family nuclease